MQVYQVIFRTKKIDSILHTFGGKVELKLLGYLKSITNSQPKRCGICLLNHNCNVTIHATCVWYFVWLVSLPLCHQDNGALVEEISVVAARGKEGLTLIEKIKWLAGLSTKSRTLTGQLFFGFLQLHDVHVNLCPFCKNCPCCQRWGFGGTNGGCLASGWVGCR